MIPRAFIASFCFSLALVPLHAAPDPMPFPTPPSIKGLQVQMVDDALALGIHHAALNVSLGPLFDLESKPDSIAFKASDGGEYFFSAVQIAALDRRVKPLSDGGVVVYFILLSYRTGNAAADSWLVHPQARADHQYSIPAFNTVSPEGRSHLSAAVEFLASRYSGPSAAEHGRVWGWIVGNEANSHWMWYNRGLATLQEVVSDYEIATRLIHRAVRTASDQGRIYLSFDHHWTASMPGISEKEATPSRAFLDAFAKLAKVRGEFDWHVATHPYPDDLGNPRTWLDQAAPATDDAPHITFKNLEIMTRYLKRPELLDHGHPRRVILSEQGFHALPTPEGDQLQAAAFAYAWEKCLRCPGVDAFIWHRHVDHRDEGGLRLGLYERKSDSTSEPGQQRPLWNLMKAAGTPAWPAAAAFALPIVGLKSWQELPGEP